MGVWNILGPVSIAALFPFKALIMSGPTSGGLLTGCPKQVGYSCAHCKGLKVMMGGQMRLFEKWPSAGHVFLTCLSDF